MGELNSPNRDKSGAGVIQASLQAKNEQNPEIIGIITRSRDSY